MTFISYAQNYEDVMLHRALKNIDKGFYIDIGANDPIADSVTKVFYDAGWRGINVEPVREWFNKYEEERPEDINLQLAIGECEGKVDFYEVVGTGLSTMDESIAKRHAQEHDFEIKSYKVPVTQLAIICDKYAADDIHFLKIDVEGAEASVLNSLDLKKVRPWIILVESTQPRTQIQSYKDWEPVLVEAEYEFVYFDGLNRFYVAKEHSEVKHSLAIPPNIFDDYLVSGTGSSKNHVYVAELQGLRIEAQDQAEEQELGLKKALLNAQQQNREIKKQAQDLKEQNSHKDEKLREAENAINSLNNELETSTQKADKLHQSNHHWWSMADRLNKELAEVRAKTDELNQSSHHCWLESERLNKELQTFYRSKSWRITWPLRKLMQFTTRLFYIPVHVVIWLIRLPNRTVRYLSVKLMAYVLKRPSLKLRARRFLRKHPKVEARLRTLATARNLIFVQAVEPSTQVIEAEPIDRMPKVTQPDIEPSESESLTENEGIAADERLSQLTPKARSIYRMMLYTTIKQERQSR